MLEFFLEQTNHNKDVPRPRSVSSRKTTSLRHRQQRTFEFDKSHLVRVRYAGYGRSLYSFHELPPPSISSMISFFNALVMYGSTQSNSRKPKPCKSTKLHLTSPERPREVPNQNVQLSLLLHEVRIETKYQRVRERYRGIVPTED